MFPAGNGYRVSLAGVYGHICSVQLRFSKHTRLRAHMHHSLSFLQWLWLPGQPHSLLLALWNQGNFLKNQAALGIKMSIL